ncbi:MAG TPA: amino acid adenylation domain-containing protein [Gemmatimonadales bacterium]
MAPRIQPSESFIEFSLAEVEQSIPRRFERQVERYSERRAIKVGNSTLTYGELNRLANRVAWAIQAHGSAPDEPIALLLDHSANLIAALLGALKAGRIYLPLDPSYPVARNTYILEDAGASLIVTGDRHLALATEFNVAGLPILNLDRLDLTLADTNLDLEVQPDTPAYILYTSGSTGRPKGVVQSHRNVLWDIREYTNTLRISRDERMTLLYSCSVNGSVRGIFGALLNGASLYPLDVKEQGLNGLAELLIREEITFYHSVPSVFRHFVATLKGVEHFPNLRLIRFGGERVLANDVESYRKHFPDDCLLYTGMGATETGHLRHFFHDKRTPITGSVVPAGYAVEGKEVLLLDGAGREVPAGETGEIAVRSRYLALGYWRKPDLTRAAFLSDPTGGPERMFRTGDMGRLHPDGCLELQGRKDFQVKVRGYRVEVGEIEAVLLSLVGVREAVVVAREEGTGEARLIAYVVRQLGRATTIAELRRLMLERLPTYMVPVVFVWVDNLPLLPNGKLDRRSLPEPARVSPERDHPFVSPRTAIEEAVAAIWGEVLGVESVGVDDHFLELGGTSLRATQVMARLRSTLGVHLPQRTLFDEPSLAEFAARVAAARQPDLGARGTAAIARIPSDTPVPLSYAQQRMWFFNQLEPDNWLYNRLFGPLGMSSRPCACRWRGPLDRRALELSLGEIVRRHEALRTRFPYTSTGVVQEILPATPFHLPVEDLSELAADDCERSARERVLAEYHRPFDLTDEPPFRAVVLQLGPEDYVLAAVIHHIAYDRWSRGILLRELALLYTAYSAGEASPLPEPALQYRDYASWQREQVEGGALRAELDYWREQLRGASDPLQLPTDRPRPALPSHEGGCCSIPLSAELIERLELLGHSERASLMMVLVAGLQAQLSGYTGQMEVSLGLAVAGRTRLELEEMVGCYTNTLVLRTDLSGDLTFRDLLRRVRGDTLKAYAHQELPFERLVEELRPQRAPGYHPFFQVLFNYLEVPRQATEIPGVRIEDFQVGLDTALVDLSVHVERTDAGTTCYFTYSSDLFDHARVARWVGDYRALLEAAVCHPELPLSILPPRGRGDRKNAEDLLAELEEMSEEEAERALGIEASPQTAKAPPGGGAE